MILIYVLASIIFLIALWFIFYIICSILVDTKKEYTENSPFYRFILNAAACVAIFVLRIKPVVSGKEKLDKNKKYLFVSNHRSNLDPILTWYLFREYDIAFVSKPENFKVPIFGNIIHKCGFIPIDRNNPFKAIESINKASSILKSGNMSVGIYPEGTRNTKNEMLPFHNGVFSIAKKSASPIAVVSIIDSDKVNSNIPFRKTKIQIDVLEVISPEDLKALKTNDIGEKIRQILALKLKVKNS